jgi:hypothetical protein
MAAAIAPPDQPTAPDAGGGPPPAATGFSAVFRREDDEICHTRCRAPLGYRGIRGREEVDFYCLSCTATVTVPAVLLASLLGAPAGPPLRVVAARGKRERAVRAPVYAV